MDGFCCQNKESDLFFFSFIPFLLYRFFDAVKTTFVRTFVHDVFL